LKFDPCPELGILEDRNEGSGTIEDLIGDDDGGYLSVGEREVQQNSVCPS
jgi:hypothetical protein